MAVKRAARRADISDMTVPATGDAPMGAHVDDLHAWVRTLAGCPPVTHTLQATCQHPAYGGEALTWFFVEASAVDAIARLRCVACGRAIDVLDSGARWSYPPMHACAGCAQSMVEVVVGVHTEAATGVDVAIEADGTGGPVTWAAVTCRCVTCGRLEGLTDMWVDPVPLERLPAALWRGATPS